MTEVPNDAAEAEGPRSAYDLLTTPTADLTDEDVELIIEDLRQRRHAYVTEGKKDEPHKRKKAPVTKEEKAENTAGLASLLGLDD